MQRTYYEYTYSVDFEIYLEFTVGEFTKDEVNESVYLLRILIAINFTLETV